MKNKNKMRKNDEMNWSQIENLMGICKRTYQRKSGAIRQK